MFEEDKRWNWHDNLKECMDDTREGEPKVLKDTFDTGEGEPPVLEDTLVDSAPQVPINHDTSSEPLINHDSDPEGNKIVEEEESLLAMMMCKFEDPPSFEEGHINPKWRAAMYTEINAIEKNHTWELVDLPKGITHVDMKWIFKTKLNESGRIEKYNARLVAKGDVS